MKHSSSCACHTAGAGPADGGLCHCYAIWDPSPPEVESISFVNSQGVEALANKVIKSFSWI